ncbi:hypothetical protein G9A89_009347 [Geosiphon pyriformis]|nr:hypothetical protein G9A89_009347 [Geosiphon pyriformis]
MKTIQVYLSLYEEFFMGRLLLDYLKKIFVSSEEASWKLKHINENETGKPFVILSPKDMVYKPETKQQLIKALCCVLTTLKALHKIKIMHRDIHWENVLKFINRDKWFIIDFYDMCYTTSPTSNTYFAKENHTPEIFQDNYNESVDIWSVGYLILTASVQLQEFDELNIYARKLKAKNKFDRPRVEDAYSGIEANMKIFLKRIF